MKLCHQSFLIVSMWMIFIPVIQATENAAADAELDSTITLYRTDGPDAALPEFERLYEEFCQSGDRTHAATAERYIGESHWRLGNYSQSKTHLDSALTQMRELRLRLAEGKTLNVLGLLHWDEGNYQQAIRYFEQASLIGDELGDRRLAGSTMNNLSLVYDEMGDYQTSLKQYQQALDLYQGANFPRGEGDTLGNIGGVNLLLGRYVDALGFYRRALEISEALESKPAMSLDHGNLALCYLGLGQVSAALEHFDLALELAVETGMRKEEALWLRGKGNALMRRGQYDLGLQFHRTALATYEEINARGLLLDALHDMGRLLLMLGDTVSAEQYFQRGIQLAREIGHARGITSNMLVLGDLDFHRAHYEEAEALYRQTSVRATEAGELNYQVESLLRLSLVHRQQKNWVQAEAEARQALAIAEQIDARFAVSEAWFAIGELHRQQGQPGAALESYALAEHVAPADSNPNLAWQIHYGKARAQIQVNERQQAMAELQAAVKIIESVRDRLREDRFRAGYVQDKYQVYIDLVRLQLNLGMTQAAMMTAERLRAQSFLAQLENGASFSRNEQQRQEEFVLRERIRALHRELEKEQDLPPPEQRQLAMDSFSSELLVAEREYQAFLDDTRGSSAIAQIASIPTLVEVQSRLRPNEALVEYVIDDDRIMIFVMHQEKLTAVTTELSHVNLVAKVNLLRELIQEPSNTRWWAPAASLSAALIQPLRQQKLLEGATHLYLVPHGILNYLPFALLPLSPEKQGPLSMEEYSLTYLPAAAALVRPGQRAEAKSSLLAMAPARGGLQYSLDEARSIGAMYDPDSRVLAGPRATETAFKEQSGSFAFLHLSTHGYFNALNPLLSGLELEADENNDGLLEVHEILDLSLDATLVTLSACETGMGSGYFNEIPAGDEFVGLTRAFLLAGSRSVLATLWKVDDRSTVELMEGFYRGLVPTGRGQDQAEALASVQRNMRRSARYGHPFYWAPFVLVGGQNSNMSI